MHPADLDRALKQLPAPHAPRTLLPRVMAAVQAWTLRPWYQRAWFTWPLAAQVALVVSLVACASGSVLLLLATEAAFAPPVIVELIGRVSAIAQSAEVTSSAVRIIWRALLQPFVPYAFALIALMSLACAVLGAALNRVASGRTIQP